MHWHVYKHQETHETMRKFWQRIFNEIDSDRQHLSGQDSLKIIGSNLAIAVVYSLLATVSLEFISLPGKVASVWLPSGFTFAIFYYYRFKALPGIICGSMFGLVTLFFDWKFSFASFVLLNLVCTLANCFQPLISTWIFQKKATLDRALNRVQSASFFVMAAAAGPFVSATMGITISYWIGTITWKDYGVCWLSWWLASTLAHLIFTPPILLLKELGWQQIFASLKRAIGWTFESSAIVVFTAAIVWIDFFYGYPLAYVLFAILIWSVFRLGELISALGVAIISLAAIIATSQGTGSFSDRTPNESIILLQSFIGILSITGLILSATVQERQAIRSDLVQMLETLEIRIEERTADLRLSEAQLDAFFSAAPWGMGIIDHHYRYVRVNQVLAKINGLPESGHLGRLIWDVVPGLRSSLEPLFQAVFTTGDSILNQEINAQVSAQSRIDNTWLVSYFPIFDMDHQPYRVGFLVMDITDRKRLELQLAHQARIDGLTQIANRRHFDEVLRSEWNRCLRSTQPLSLMLCDADYFKKYNDTYGHLMGDRCLVAIAQVLREHARRSSDLAARYGGEEFAILLPNTTLAEAVQLAHQIRGQIHQLAIPHRGSQVSSHVTLSIGIMSHIPQSGDEICDLITGADRSLYEAKQQGRDRIVALPYEAIRQPSSLAGDVPRDRPSSR